VVTVLEEQAAQVVQELPQVSLGHPSPMVAAEVLVEILLVLEVLVAAVPEHLEIIMVHRERQVPEVAAVEQEITLLLQPTALADQAS